MSPTLDPSNSDPWRAARDAAIVTRLDALALVDVDGADAATFLNGQLSSDVLALERGRGHWTSYNSPKGRMLANPFLYRPLGGPAFRLVVPVDIAEPVRKRLTMFVLRSKVTLAENRAVAAIGVGGPGGGDAVRSALGVAASAHAVVAAPGAPAEVVGLPDGRILIVVDAAGIDDVLARLARTATTSPQDVWRWLGIRAGVAQIGAATQDRHVAQTANWEVVGGVSFTKGCYTGQEIVARAQHLGVLKERAHPFRIDAAAPPPGTPLVSPVFGDQACGSVLDAVDLPGGGAELLAVVQVSAADAPGLRLGSADGAPLEPLPLPYTLPTSAPRRVKL